MELEKTLTIAAPVARVWALLLDPKIMAGCVPGTGSVEVLSDTEYLAEIKVKISFIAARFKVRTRILEARAPEYLRIEGTGEDASVTSSMRQSSELFLTDLGDGSTEIRVKAKADVLGRLGSFGLAMMKTKADRMWEEFGANFTAVVLRDMELGHGADSAKPDGQAYAPPGSPALTPVQDAAGDAAAEGLGPVLAPQPVGTVPQGQQEGSTKPRWWQRLVGTTLSPTGLGERRLASDIYVELHRADGVVKVLWPASAAPEAARWLKDLR
ncbi:CoxG family protein [Roseomonas populi]|uniref:SRPBCC family protein n=1 Tax=Roseomonas populi TaxID=3121582 RepID=A0ABT1X3K1_9PROT|nr:SRPBCC family protein [Roseomonas pecuniae]MCR0982687.1 SRPBCC family protein [Roseomonas pecuniae]